MLIGRTGEGERRRMATAVCGCGEAREDGRRGNATNHRGGEMAKRAATVKATAGTKKAAAKNAAKTDHLPTVIGTKREKRIAKPLAEKAAASPAANGKSPSTKKACDRPLCWQCKVRQLSADDVRRKVGVCEECRNPSRRVARWARDEELQARFPEEFEKSQKPFKYHQGYMSFGLPEWRAIYDLLEKLAQAGRIDKAKFQDAPASAMIEWLLNKRLPGSSVNEILQLSWQEAEELVRAEVEKIEADRQNGAVESLELPHLGMVLDEKRNEITRLVYEKPVYLGRGLELKRLFRELLERGDNPIDCVSLKTALGKSEGAVRVLIVRLKNKLLDLEVTIPDERYHLKDRLKASVTAL